MVAGSAFAFDFSKLNLRAEANTSLIEFAQVSESSRTAAGFRSGGYESAGGSWISFDRWYQNIGFKDTRLTWMSQLSPSLGLLWGFSTGEHGDKYRIDPSFKVGFVYQTNFGRHSYISIKATTLVGGWMKEKPCTADYGEIGGVQAVNCRLAASTLSPSDTLRYLINNAPADKDLLFVRYNYEF